MTITSRAKQFCINEGRKAAKKNGEMPEVMKNRYSWNTQERYYLYKQAFRDECLSVHYRKEERAK